VADCLVPVTFTEGEPIIQQGQEAGPTAKFYIVESGRVDCFRAEAPGVSSARVGGDGCSV